MTMTQMTVINESPYNVTKHRTKKGRVMAEIIPINKNVKLFR